ncbi:MAG: glycosyltransferase family 9 protein [Bacteroidetes bacterium]|nr:glycosyltransferase family 9 protein [Bacteroidota bacterium]
MARKTSGIQDLGERILNAGLLLFDRLALAFTRKPQKGAEHWILVVKVDLLGDYVLMRNFLEIIKQSPKYQGYKLAFCCNQSITPLSRQLDAGVVDEWLPLKPKPFIRNLGYRWRFLSKFRSRKYVIALFPTHSRAYLYDDTLARWAIADKKMAPVDNGHNHLHWQHARATALYHMLVPNTLGLAFEFYLNRAFFGALLGSDLEISSPHIQVSMAHRQDLVVLSPGASKPFRQWPAQHFVSLGQDLLARYPHLRLAITGAPSESALCAEIAQGLAQHGRVSNCGGTLTLIDLVKLLAKAKLLIANESGVVHLAQALRLPVVICLSNGNHLGRFNPYPPTTALVDMRYCYPPAIGLQEDINSQLIEKYYWGSTLPIHQVPLAQVRQYLHQVSPGLFGSHL